MSAPDSRSVVLLSTTIADSNRVHVIDRMLEGVDNACETLSSVKLLFLVQGPETTWTSRELGPHVEVLHVPETVSLSKARNILLDHARNAGAIKTDSVVAFPDDDSWYPANVLENIVDMFDRQPELDFWFCQYGSDVKSADSGKPFATKPAHISEVVRNASSNTMFVRGRAALACGDFDESLGVGTELGGAEDLDYALRVMQQSRSSLYTGQRLIGHRDKGTSRSNYYRSSLFVLTRHARTNADIRREQLRKLAVGIVLTLKGELKPKDFVRSLAQAKKAMK